MTKSELSKVRSACAKRRAGSTMTEYPPWAAPILQRMRRKQASQGDISRASGQSKGQVYRWLRYGHPPSHPKSQRAILQAFQAIGCNVEPLVRAALDFGGRPTAIMKGLIEEGFVRQPGSKAAQDQLSIQEAAMRREFLRARTMAHFSIPRDPFLEPGIDDEVFFDSKRIRDVADWFIECATRGEQMFALVGEVGCGKTTLVRHCLNRLEAEHNFMIVWPELPDKGRVTANSLMTAILKDLADRPKLYVESELKSREAREILKRVREQHYRVLVVIDEGHDLTMKILHTLKRMNEWRDGYRKLLSIAVLAQPEIHAAINNFSVREFAMRLSVLEFPGLHRAEPFLKFRLRKAGMSDAQIGRVIGDDAWKAFEGKVRMLREEGGKSAVTPLAVQNLLARILNLTAEAGDSTVTPAHVEHVQGR